MTMTLWKFRVTVKSRTEAVRSDGELARDGRTVTFLGSALDARAMAEAMQHQLAPQHPGQDVTVRPVQAEQLGPLTISQIAKLGAEREEAKAVARLLAWRLAERAAKESLEINPDIAALAQDILDVAAERVAQELQKARPVQKQTVILDGHGNIARA
jgi:hypothetical protein